MVFLELWQKALSSSRVALGTSGNHSCCLREVRPLSSCEGHLRFLSSHCRGIGPHLELRQGAQVSSPVATGISVFLSSLSMEVRPRLGFMHETPLSSQVVKGVPGLLASSGRELGLF